MTKLEALKKGVAARQDMVMKKGDEYQVGWWTDFEYAKSEGWEFVGSVPAMAEAEGLF